MYSLVYVLTNKINGKRYVGSTSQQLRERLRDHMASSTDTHISSALNKYGIENFNIETIPCHPEHRLAIEHEITEQLGTYVPQGYNVATHCTSRPNVYPNGSRITSIRLDNELRDKVYSLAEEQNTSVSQLVNRILEDHIELLDTIH